MPTMRVKGVLTIPPTQDSARVQAAVAGQFEARSLTATALNRVDAEAGQSLLSIDATFTSAAEAETFYEWVQAQLNQRGGLYGTVTIHACGHAAGETQNQRENCRSGTATQFRQAVGSHVA